MRKDLDVLLINAPSPNPGAILSHRVQGLPPLGICYIATRLNQKGYCAELIDLYIRSVTLNNVYEALYSKKPKIVGISTTTETYKTGMRLAAIIKEFNEEIIIVMGGCHVTFEYEDALSGNTVDFVIRGEGELTFEELCKCLLKGKGTLAQVDGLSYIQNNCVVSTNDRCFIKDLDALAFPDRNLFDLDKYSQPATLSTSRGCPGKCIFCAASALSGGKYRIRSAGSVVDEIIYLKELGYSNIQVIDDTLTANVKRLNQILDLLIDENLNINWAGESRVDIITKDLLERMKQSGCNSLQFGVESGNQEMLDCMKKKITLEQVRNVFRWCNEVEIRPSSCLIIGQPFDTLETIKDTVDIGLELQEMGAQIVFSISTPYPGTYMYEHTKELGIQIMEQDTDNYTTQTPVYNSKYLTADEIQNEFFNACVKLGRHNHNTDIKKKYETVRNTAMEITSGGTR